MRRFRVRQYGQEGWTFIDIKGDLAAGVHNIVARALESWCGNLNIQELVDGEWEDLI